MPEVITRSIGGTTVRPPMQEPSIRRLRNSALPRAEHPLGRRSAPPRPCSRNCCPNVRESTPPSNRRCSRRRLLAPDWRLRGQMARRRTGSIPSFAYASRHAGRGTKFADRTRRVVIDMPIRARPSPPITEPLPPQPTAQRLEHPGPLREHYAQSRRRQSARQWPPPRPCCWVGGGLLRRRLPTADCLKPSPIPPARASRRHR